MLFLPVLCIFRKDYTCKIMWSHSLHFLNVVPQFTFFFVLAGKLGDSSCSETSQTNAAVIIVISTKTVYMGYSKSQNSRVFECFQFADLKIYQYWFGYT